MLRAALLAVAGLVAVVGAVLLLVGQIVAGAYALGLGVAVVLGTLFERWRYRRDEPHAVPGWEPTGERFEDPQTGKTVQVFYDPKSGERRYVTDHAE